MRSSMKMIRLFVFISLVALVLGCGQQTSNSGFASFSGNEGEIAGYVYDLEKSNVANKTFMPLASAEVWVGDKKVYSDNNGFYRISGIPTGEVTLVASSESCYPTTFKMNRNAINVYLSPMSYSSFPQGTSTIKGRIKNIPPILKNLNLYIVANSSKNYKSSYINSRTLQNTSEADYIIERAPDDGLTYVSATSLNSNVGIALAKVTTSPNTTIEVDLIFGSNSISGNIQLPAGYETSRLGINFCEDSKCIDSRASTGFYLHGLSTYEITSLPEFNKDYYVFSYLSIRNTNSNCSDETISKVLPVKSWGKNDFSFSTLSHVELGQDVPKNESIVNAISTFSWDVSGFDNGECGRLSIYDASDYGDVFDGYTNSRSFDLSAINFKEGHKYYWDLLVFPSCWGDPADFYGTIDNSKADVLIDRYGSFYYKSKPASVNTSAYNAASIKNRMPSDLFLERLGILGDGSR